MKSQFQSNNAQNNGGNNNNNNNNSIFPVDGPVDPSHVSAITDTPPPSRVIELHYGFTSSKEVLQHSVMPVRRQVNSNDSNYSVRDTRLGVCNRMDRCGTCGEKLEKCIGHIGHVALALPVFHPGLFNAMLRVLRTICKNCSAVLLLDSFKSMYDKRIRAAQGDIYRLGSIVKEIVNETAKCRQCYKCNSINGVVRHVRPYRVVHFKYEGVSGPAGVTMRSRDDDLSADSAENLYRTTFSTANLLNDGVSNTRSQVVEFLDPVRIRTLLANVHSQDHVFFGMQPGVALEDLVMINLPITPICTRPHGLSLNGMDLRDDDITRLYLDVINTNEALRSASTGTQGSAAASVVHWWNDLQFRLVRLMDAGMPGYLPSQRAQQPIKSFAQRLKGKHGRFRGNLSGKRVDFSGRSVISPDPNLEIDEVAIPLRVAKSLTYPQKVFQHNLALMKKFVQNGPDTHPGALTVILKEDGSRKDLRYHDRHAIAQRLAPGDTVERHCINGDFIIFNRQPSLHRLSMMTHRARVLPHRTLRFNECCCAPYNADFDGDEMNIHLVQTEDARAEAHTLMSTVRNIISAKNGEPIIACTQDFLTGAFLLSSMDTFLDRSQFSNCVAYWASSYGNEDFDLPPPTIYKPRELWTGKQVFDVIIQPRVDPTRKNSVTPVRPIEMNLEAAGGQYTKGARSNCKNEAWVTFHRSHLVTGRLDKKLLGGGAKDGLFAQLNVVAGTEVAARVMGRVARTTSRWLQNRGFSLGLGDVAITQSVQERKVKVVAEAFDECSKLIKDSNEGRLQPAPGLTIRETLEAHLNGVLSKVRETCGNEAVKVLHRSNAPLVMAQSGSKGSVLNIAQMMAVVGQQTVNGKRIKHSFFNRTLPHVPRFAEDPAARGFVASSFFSGLKPTEFFFHTMAGREGLVDTAVKTADTGYIQRRVMKACEDLSVQYDWTVRTAKKNIVQFCFGEDSLDPLVMEGGNNSPVNFAAMWKNLVNAEPDLYTSILHESSLFAMKSAAEAVQTLSLLMSGKISNGNNTGEVGQDAAAVAIAYNGISSVTDNNNNNNNKNQNYFGADPDELEKMATALIALHEEKSRFTSKFTSDLTKFVTDLINRYREIRIKLYGDALPELRKDNNNNEDAAVATSLVSGKGKSSQQQQNNSSKKATAPASSTTSKKPNNDQHQPLLDVEALSARLNSLANLVPCSAALLKEFLARCAKKYISKRCEPGSPCGALAAQSLCEPATQMTLRTFHFAGVASMSVTMGVPRLKEIINASKSIKTPIVTAPLFDKTRAEANSSKAAVERLTLRDVAVEVTQVIAPARVFLRFTLNRVFIDKLKIHLTSYTVRQKILEFSRRPMSPLKELTEGHFDIEDQDHFLVRPYRDESNQVFFILQNLRAILLDIHIHGIDSARRVIVNAVDEGSSSSNDNNNKYQLLAETSEFLRVITLPFVDGYKTTCNHVDAVATTLGIEAARTLIVNEIKAVLGAYSMSVDVRHIQLIADVMTHRGVVLGIQNYGIQKMNSGVLTMASFERTTDHLYNACVFQRSDRSLSVSESIIVGTPIPLGTNSFGLLLNNGTNAVQNSQMASAARQPVTTSSTSVTALSTLSSKGIVAGPVATFASSINSYCSSGKEEQVNNKKTAQVGAGINSNNNNNNDHGGSPLITPRNSTVTNVAAGIPNNNNQAGPSLLKVSFQSIFERSPLTAGPPQAFPNSNNNNNNSKLNGGVTNKKRTARLYSMERARSGSFALDLSSANK